MNSRKAGNRLLKVIRVVTNSSRQRKRWGKDNGNEFLQNEKDLINVRLLLIFATRVFTLGLCEM